MNLHTRRQLRIDERDLLFQLGHHLGSVTALGHLHNAFNHGIAVVVRHHAGAIARADQDLTEIRQQHGLAVLRLHHHTPDVLEIVEDAHAANHE